MTYLYLPIMILYAVDDKQNLTYLWCMRHCIAFFSFGHVAMGQINGVSFRKAGPRIGERGRATATTAASSGA